MADDLGDHGDVGDVGDLGDLGDLGDQNHGDCGEDWSLVIVGLVFYRVALCTFDNEQGFAF